MANVGDTEKSNMICTNDTSTDYFNYEFSFCELYVSIPTYTDVIKKNFDP